MANKLKLNIQLFGELSFLPTEWDRMVGDYESELSNLNDIYSTNQETLEIFKRVAGSKKLSEGTRNMIEDINKAVASTANYFNSVRGWADDVVDKMNAYMQQQIQAITGTFNDSVLGYLNEEYNGGFVGIERTQDVTEYVSSINDVINRLKSSLSSMTESVAGAKNSLPDVVQQALSRAISTNNEDALTVFDNASRFLTENLESFTQEFSSALDSLAANTNANA